MTAEYKLPEQYVEAEAEAKKFLKRLAAFKVEYQKYEWLRLYSGHSSAERAALKRTSMDLSKALVKLRQS